MHVSRFAFHVFTFSSNFVDSVCEKFFRENGFVVFRERGGKIDEVKGHENIFRLFRVVSLYFVVFRVVSRFLYKQEVHIT